MRIENPIIRRAQRVLAMVHELHKLGYQNVCIYSGMSSSGFHWRCSVVPFSECFIDNVSGEIDIEFYDIHPSYSSGESGNCYFSWEDAINDNARELAAKFIERFPRLVEQCKGANYEYAGWFSYMLGISETGALPVMYRDYYQADRGKIKTTEIKVDLVAPPYTNIRKTNNLKYKIKKAPHLGIEDDWHDAYKPIVDSLLIDSLPSIPEYPIYTNDKYEMGAYWEGAIYYIQEVLGFTSIAKFIQFEERGGSRDKNWVLFQMTWNSHGQFSFLKAFLLRHILIEDKQEEFDGRSREKWTNWLKAFLSLHGITVESISDMIPFESPYDFETPFFGGRNPLHLGLNLTQYINKEKLVEI